MSARLPVVALREDQWDLIVLALQRVRAMAALSESRTSIDILSRNFLKRRIDEAVASIQDAVPSAGAEVKP